VEARRGRTISPEVVRADGAADGSPRGLHDSALNLRVAERFASLSDPKAAHELRGLRSALVLFPDHELPATEKHRSSIDQVRRDRPIR
jgi:hypothetical protein